MSVRLCGKDKSHGDVFRSTGHMNLMSIDSPPNTKSAMATYSANRQLTLCSAFLNEKIFSLFSNLGFIYTSIGQLTAPR